MKAILVATAAVWSGLMCAPAMAQQAAPPPQPEEPATDSGGLGEIVVTATRRAENLQDVPIAISAIAQEDLQARGVFDTSDLNNTLPNLQVSSPYGQQQPNFSLRGVGVGTEFNPNAASPVGVYVDEVYQSFRSSHGQQLYDLEQIEVVRGPQGTLYGRNTTGGAINFITRAPTTKDNRGYATIGYGNYNRHVFQGAVEVAPVENVFGIRLAIDYTNADPYLRNVLPAGPNTFTAFGASGLNRNSGISSGGTQSFAGRLSLRLKPSDGIDLKLKIYAAEAKGGTEGPIPTGQSLTSDRIDYTNSNLILGSLFQALAPLGLLPSSYSASARGLDPLEVEQDSIGRAITQSRGIVFDARFDLGDRIRLTSITGYDDGRYVQSQTDCDGTPLRGCTVGYDSKLDSFNQDLRLNYDGTAFKAILGGYFGWDRIVSDNTPDFFDFLSDVRAATGLPATYFNPGGAFNGSALSAASLPTGIRATQHYRQTRKSYAVYGEASYEVTPTLKFTAGLRYTKDEIRFRDGLTTYFDDAGNARLITVSAFRQNGAFAPYFLQPVRNEAGAIVIPSFTSLGLPLPAPLSQDGRSNSVTGRAIVDWKPVEGVMLYASYSRGYRAGTYNGLSYGSAAQVYFVPPEEVDAYEVGLKSRFLDNRVQLNLSGFYYDYRGQQGQVVDSSATANLVSLDGTIKGFEGELLFQPTPQLRLSASVGYLDTKYADGACPANPATIPSFPAQLGSCIVSAAGPVSVAGNPFPFAPEWSTSFGADWDLIDTGSTKLTVHGDANYVGQFYYDSFRDYSRAPLNRVATGALTQGGGDYWVVNGRVTMEVGRFTIAAWAKNLFNETYYPFGISLENLFGDSYRVRGLPRTYGAELTVRF